MAVGEIEKNLDWKRVEKEIVCPICERVFTNPKTTPCLHTFCKECLETRIEAARELATAAAPRCPICHKVLPQCSDYPSDFRINRLIEIFNKRLAVESSVEGGKVSQSVDLITDSFRGCVKCEEDLPVVSWCVDCQGFLCHDCSEIHGKWKEFKVHTTMTLDDMNHPEDFVVKQQSR